MNKNSIDIHLPYKFKPRPYQLPFLKALDSGIKRAVCVFHRGAGKDLMALNYLINRAMQKPGVYLHCFPNYTQGKRAIWTSVHETHDGEPIGYMDHIPPQLIKSKNSSEMTVQLVNGSVYCVMGLDGRNAQRARGMNPSFVILSEYAYMDPEAWYTLEPRITQNKGTAVFLSTPNGQNHFYQLYNHALSNPKEYYANLVSIDHTNCVDKSHIDSLRREGVPEDFIQQEYYCSFTRGAEGSYYGKLIQKVRDDDRICSLPIMPDLPVHSAWDIGIGDSSSIWLFQTLQNGTINFIHYYENHGEGLQHYIEYLNNWKEKKRVIWGKHFVPHDMENREFTSGVDRLSSMRDFGYDALVIPKKPLAEGIQAVRSTIPLSSFDITNCNYGIKCLDFYHKKYNEALKVYYDEPVHDRWSHGADAFRYACLGIRIHGTGSSGSLESDYKALRNYWG